MHSSGGAICTTAQPNQQADAARALVGRALASIWPLHLNSVHVTSSFATADLLDGAVNSH